MRLENKMHKWLKFILKIFPFLPLIFNLVALIGSDLAPFFSINPSDDYVQNYENWWQFIDSSTYFLINASIELVTLPDFLNDFNAFFVDLFGWSGANGSEPIFWVLSFFEWFLFIDFLDLILSAFRFIIDICRSWLDSFYDKNKGGYK